MKFYHSIIEQLFDEHHLFLTENVTAYLLIVLSDAQHWK